MAPRPNAVFLSDLFLSRPLLSSHSPGHLHASHWLAEPMAKFSGAIGWGYFEGKVIVGATYLEIYAHSRCTPTSCLTIHKEQSRFSGNSSSHLGAFSILCQGSVSSFSAPSYQPNSVVIGYITWSASAGRFDQAYGGVAGVRLRRCFPKMWTSESESLSRVFSALHSNPRLSRGRNACTSLFDT